MNAIAGIVARDRLAGHPRDPVHIESTHFARGW